MRIIFDPFYMLTFSILAYLLFVSIQDRRNDRRQK